MGTRRTRALAYGPIMAGAMDYELRFEEHPTHLLAHWVRERQA